MREEERKLGRGRGREARKGGGGETRLNLMSAASRWRCGRRGGVLGSGPPVEGHRVEIRKSPFD